MGVAIIHVFDDASRTSRDFRCDIRLLLAHMRLLAADLQDVPGHDVEITVKCDVSTFAWLMAYVKADSRGEVPVIDLSNCLHLMLASNYLQMRAVLTSSVAYVAAHLADLTATASEQLCSLTKPLLDMLGKAVLEETLETLHTHCEHQQHHQQLLLQQHHPSESCSSGLAPMGSSLPPAARHSSGSGPQDPSSRSSMSSSVCDLVEKLYKHKLRALLQQHSTTLLQCKACGELFATSSHTLLQCPAGIRRSSRQHKLTLHEPDPCWSLQQYLAQQRSKPAQHKQHQEQQQQQPLQLPTELLRLQQCPQHQQRQVGDSRSSQSWRELYWLVWGHVVVLYCQHCCSHFPAKLFHRCGYHPLPAVFVSDMAEGQYPCCGQPAWRPGAPAHQPCCSRDHLPYLADSTSQALQQEERTGSVGEAGRALQLLRLHGHLITAAPPAVQQQQQLAGCEAASSGDCRSKTPDHANNTHQQQQHRTMLPLLVKMVNKGAVAAAAAAGATAATAPADDGGAGASGAGRRSNSPCPRPASPGPLPPIASPRQLAVGGQPHSTLQSGNELSDHQQQLVRLPGGAELCAGPPGRCSLVRVAGKADTSCSDSHSRASSSSGSGRVRACQAEADCAGTVAQEHADCRCSSSDSSSGSSSGSSGSLTDAAGHTPLSSIMGAVRAAAEARTKGLGFSAVAAGGSRAGGGRLRTQVRAPLAETFSAGGKRVLAQTGRAAPRVSGPEPSRPSTAASLLSLKQQQQVGGGSAASRPGTSSSRLAAGSMNAAAVSVRDKLGVMQPGELSSVATTFNRTLLLELVQQDDAYRMGVLMRRLDALRLQPPPNCHVAGSHTASKRARQTGRDLGAVVKRRRVTCSRQ